MASIRSLALRIQTTSLFTLPGVLDRGACVSLNEFSASAIRRAVSRRQFPPVGHRLTQLRSLVRPTGLSSALAPSGRRAASGYTTPNSAAGAESCAVAVKLGHQVVLVSEFGCGGACTACFRDPRLSVGLCAGHGMQFTVGEQPFDGRFRLSTICSCALPGGVAFKNDFLG